MKTATKNQMVEWLGNFHNNCEFTDYFGYKMSIEDFKKEMMKKKSWELSEIIFNTNDEGQKFIKSFVK